MERQVGRKIREVRRKAGLTQAQLGAAIGKSEATIRQYEADQLQVWRHPDILENLARALKIDVRELVESSPMIGVKPTTLRSIPLYTEIPAGLPAAQYSDVETIEIRDWGNDHQRWARIVRGDSMAPLLQTGDIAVFEEGRAESGMVVHAFHDGDDTVKILRRKGSDVLLEPLNPDYEAFLAENWKVKGFLVMIIRDLGGGTQQTWENRWGLRP